MKLKKVIRIRSVLLAKTGLRIGMSRDQMAIGDLDNPVVRNPLTDEPYIPGSSLKGKLRYLLEWSLGGDYILKAKDKHVYASPDPKDPVARILGLAPEHDERSLAVARERGPTSLHVRGSTRRSSRRSSSPAWAETPTPAPRKGFPPGPALGWR